MAVLQDGRTPSGPLAPVSGGSSTVGPSGGSLPLPGHVPRELGPHPLRGHVLLPQACQQTARSLLWKKQSPRPAAWRSSCDDPPASALRFGGFGRGHGLGGRHLALEHHVPCASVFLESQALAQAEGHRVSRPREALPIAAAAQELGLSGRSSLMAVPPTPTGSSEGHSLGPSVAGARSDPTCHWPCFSAEATLCQARAALG
ncbi:uncharacterized protein C1orf159 homolog isoform X6 [Vicugna pacos]|uniref:Uncharacterized protein C1orf159 homolog isoform X6 n=1 Tax=Vicugna pacos TaxID=30538 RepID=A0ABM5EF67_VICPA